jgi:hypothetical protein
MKSRRMRWAGHVALMEEKRVLVQFIGRKDKKERYH